MYGKTHSENFEIRSINPVEDNLSSYLSWMKNTEQNKFILSANKDVSLSSLCSYVLEKNKKIDCILFGIFEKSTRKHIGNVKLEPMIENNSATLGILIGEPNFRGSGVGFEVIQQIIKFAKSDLGLKKINLGVNVKNLAAINLYSKCGFIAVESSLQNQNDITMEIML